MSLNNCDTGLLKKFLRHMEHFVLTSCRFSAPAWPLVTLTTQEDLLTKPLTSKEIQEETN